ncbi:MAG: YihY/virulence factor BrkB family protein [Bacteroidales bacterium]|nr:YihY/virulence factor BrkB family protein [Bacteroidales bacterium]
MKKFFHRIKVFFRWMSIWIKRITRFLAHDIWFLKEEDFTKWKGRLVRDLKTVVLMYNTFIDQKISYQITALAYRSMLSVVPAIAIGFFLTDGIGLRDKFAEVLYDNLSSDQQIIDSLLQAADNIVITAESGLFGFLSMFTFVWIVLSLMMTVRRVFNNVWKVDKEQSFLKMIGVIIGITILSPFVVILFFTGSVVYSNILDLLFPSQFFLSGILKSFLSWVLFAALSVAVMTLMFKYIPGTKVQMKHAFKGALVSGIAFTAVQYLYLETQVMVAKQSAIYGVLAALPLFMIWLNLGWTIMLYGAELSYAFQNVDKHSVTSEDIDKMTQDALRARRERIQNTMKKI